MKYFFGAFFLIFGICILSLSFNKSTDSSRLSKHNLELRNIEVLQASAAEMYCDQTNETACTIVMGDIIGRSKGVLRASN